MRDSLRPPPHDLTLDAQAEREIEQNGGAAQSGDGRGLIYGDLKSKVKPSLSQRLRHSSILPFWPLALDCPVLYPL